MRYMYIYIIFLFSCEKENSIELNLFEFLKGKVYETRSSSSGDFWNNGTEINGNMYVQFPETTYDWLEWNLFYKKDGEEECSFRWSYTQDGYLLENTINTPSELQVNGVYGQVWYFTKTSNTQLEVNYMNGTIPLKLELKSNIDFQELNCN